MGTSTPIRQASLQSRFAALRRALHRRRLGADDDAVFSVGPALAIAGIIIGAFIVVTVASLFIGQYFAATAVAVDAFENTSITTGNEDADSIKENVFPIILGLTALFGLGSLIIGAVSFSRYD